jgi:hypothetical protein
MTAPARTPDLDRVRAHVLDRMERSQRVTRLAILGAALLELLLFAVAFRLVDWRDPVQKLLFVFSVLSYTMLALGLIALGGHVSRSVGRVLAALEPPARD